METFQKSLTLVCYSWVYLKHGYKEGQCDWHMFFKEEEPVSLPILARSLAIPLIWSAWLSHTQLQALSFLTSSVPNLAILTLPFFIMPTFVLNLITTSKLYIQSLPLFFLPPFLLSFLSLRRGSMYLRLALNLSVAEDSLEIRSHVLLHPTHWDFSIGGSTDSYPQFSSLPSFLPSFFSSFLPIFLKY